MVARFDDGSPRVTVETVETLYANFEALEIPGLYADGGENPFAGRVSVIPRKAQHYTMVQAKRDEEVSLARLLMKGLAKRRKVREVVCSKVDVNFNQFAEAGDILVLYA